ITNLFSNTRIFPSFGVTFPSLSACSVPSASLCFGCRNGDRTADSMCDFCMSKTLRLTESEPLNDVVRHIRQFLRLRPKELLTLFKEIVIECNNDNVPRLGASLAFYTLLSL